MNPVIHFEMPYEDRERAARFYRQAFGWEMQVLGPEMNHYVLATTTETGSDGRPVTRGAINGGLFEKKPDWPGQYPSVVIGVGDIASAMTKIREAGGEVLGDPMEIPGIGIYVAFNDSEGNRARSRDPAPQLPG